ncbi:MAG: DNA recombination protein RmuC, partial [Cyanobacteria bacterium J06649_4]
MQLLFGVLGGGMLGGVAVWAILSAKMQAVREKTKNDLVAERASMVEQLRGKDQRLTELRQSLEERDRTLTQYHAQITQEAAQRATAEAQSLRIPDLEKSLLDQQSDNARLRTRLSQLETQLHELKQQSDEKLALLSDAQRQFGNAFKVLSAEALQANNQSFLKLAEANLGQFQ